MEKCEDGKHQFDFGINITKCKICNEQRHYISGRKADQLSQEASDYLYDLNCANEIFAKKVKDKVAVAKKLLDEIERDIYDRAVNLDAWLRIDQENYQEVKKSQELIMKDNKEK